jgi:hypothetical protein
LEALEGLGNCLGVGGSPEEGDDAFVLLEGVVDFVFAVGGVDGVGGDDEDEVVGAADAVEEFGFEVGAGADAFLVEPSRFAGGLPGRA